MFISVLSIVYTILVVALMVIYMTNQRENVVKWGERNGLKNNFFIRAIRKRPTKKSRKSDLSKVFSK